MRCGTTWLGALALGWVAGVCVAGPGRTPADLPKGRTIDICWTDAPPAIDGKMDDACWRDASCAKDFGLFQKAGWPTRQTEVYVCYDAANLYVFWKLLESDMDKFCPGNPPDLKDFVTWKDTPELFLDPGCTRKHFFQFVACWQGAQYDGSSKRGRGFNAEWQVKGGLFERGWTMEMAVPFTELIHPGEFIGTPRPGDRWGINFCRNQGSNSEWSQWETSMQGFQEPARFGTAVFRGRKRGPALPVVKARPSKPLFFGVGSLAFTIDGAAQGLAGERAMVRNGRKTSKRASHVAGREWTAPYTITAGGVWDVRVKLTQTGRTVYTGRARARLPRVAETVAQVRKAVDEAEGRLRGFDHPAAGELRKTVAGLETASAKSAGRLSHADRLTHADWQTLVRESGSLMKRWEGVRFDVNLIRFYPKTDTPAAFALGTARADEKVYRDTLYDGAVDGTVQCSLAGRETESFQILVLPFWKTLRNVSVRFSDLKGKGRTIPAGNLRWSRVEYVTIDDPDPDDPELHPHEPDILMPGKPFRVARGEMRSVWVDVHLPAGTPAGDYTGKVTVEAEGYAASRPLRVHAYGFDLPQAPSLKNNHWFGFCRWQPFYGHPRYTPELFERHVAVLSRYRSAAIPVDWENHTPPIYVEKDGRFTFDWTTQDRYIRIALKYGANCHWASQSCGLAALIPFTTGHWPIINRATGKKGTIEPYIKQWREQKRYYDENPIYRAYLKSCIQHLKRLGILDVSYWELYDEVGPTYKTPWLDMIRHHTFLKQFVPELKLLNWGLVPTMVAEGKSPVGLIDAWGPHLTHLAKEPELLRALYQRRAKHGEEFWFYVCGGKSDSRGLDSPFTYYHKPYLGARIIPWMAWKYQVDGFLIWTMNSVPTPNIVKEPQRRWPNAPWHDGRTRGCGTLAYPGPNYELIPGMRLAQLRDGMEDYEYFHVLRDAASKLDKARHRALLRKIEKELLIEPSIVADVYSWTKDVTTLAAKRARLAKLIQEARAVHVPRR